MKNKHTAPEIGAICLAEARTLWPSLHWQYAGQMTAEEINVSIAALAAELEDDVRRHSR